MTELEQLKADFSERLSDTWDEGACWDADRMVGLISKDEPTSMYKKEQNLVLFYIVAALAVEVEKLEARIEELEKTKCAE